MYHCEKYQAILLDHVYGLLEDPERTELEAHLRACPACEAQLATARSQQSILKHAAKAIPQVPEFTLPKAETAAILMTTPSQQTPPPTARQPGASYWRRTWVAWSTLAAVFVAVSVSASYYSRTLSTHRKTLDSARQNLRDADAAYANLPEKYARLQHIATHEVLAKAGPHLHVVGPMTFQPNGKGHIVVAVRHSDGTLAPADLRVKLVDGKAGAANVLQLMHAKADGKTPTRVEIDPSLAKADGTLKIVVEARSDDGSATVAETVRLSAPTYVTRIDVNKAVYATPDVLFFRALVLDRFALQPPISPIPLHVELIDPTGKVVRSAQLPTGAGGVLAAEFAIEENYLAGSYLLKVRPADAAKDHVQNVTLPILVVRDLASPEVEFDRENYLPGEIAAGILRSDSKLEQEANVQFGALPPMPVTVQPQAGITNQSVPTAPRNDPLNRGQFGQANKAAIAGRFEFQIPKNLPAGASRVPYVIQMGKGKEQRVIKGELPITPTEFAVDFFPEGGDMIAGVQNRVFYRVRTKFGEAVLGQGSVILLSEQGIIDSSYENGLGFFDFTPNAKEAYTVRITTPNKVEEIKNPFAKSSIRVDGLVLHVPSAVGQTGDPINLVLRHQGGPRRLLLAADCRGQLVDQQWIDLKPGQDAQPTQRDVTLQPTADAFGMIRVTAYELASDGPFNAKFLKPIAERLVYGGPAQKLDIRARLSTQQFHAGRRIQANIETLDEKGRLAGAHLLACVVDDRFQSRPRGLAAHFFLFNEIRTGADLENALLVVNDSPESVQALERFLGTHGWRRWKHEPSVVGADPGEQPIVFSVENVPLNELAKKYDDAIAAVLMPIHQDAFKEKFDLSDKRDGLAAIVNIAANELSLFESATRDRVGIALGAAVIGCLALSLGLMLVGMIRLVRSRRPATMLFGSAFGSLAACLVIVLVGRNLVTTLRVGDVALAAGDAPAGVAEKLERILTTPPNLVVNERHLVGAFAMATPEKADAKVTQSALLHEQAKQQAELPYLARALAMRDRNEPEMRTDKKQEPQRNAGNLQFRMRLDMARGGAAVGKGEAPKAKGTLPGAMKAADANRRAPEFAYEHSPDLTFDTLLWHPTLWLPNGRGEVRFDLAAGQASYRLLLLGHGPNGRFGYFEKHLDVPAMGR